MQSVCATSTALSCLRTRSPRFSANLIFGQFKGSKIGGASSLPDLSASVKSGHDLRSQPCPVDQNTVDQDAIFRDIQRYSEYFRVYSILTHVESCKSRPIKANQGITCITLLHTCHMSSSPSCSDARMISCLLGLWAVSTKRTAVGPPALHHRKDKEDPS